MSSRLRVLAAGIGLVLMIAGGMAWAADEPANVVNIVRIS